MPPVTCGIKHLQFGYILHGSIHLQEAKASEQTVARRRARASLSLFVLAKTQKARERGSPICSEVASAEVLVLSLRGLDFLSARRSGLGALESHALGLALDAEGGHNWYLFSPRMAGTSCGKRGGGGEGRLGQIFCEKLQEFWFLTRRHKGPA